MNIVTLKRHTFATAITIALGVAVCGAVHSHSVATGIVKERMDAMKEMADNSKVVVKMFKGERSFDHNAVADAASSFVEHGMQMDDLFPDTEASRSTSTEALLKL